MNKVLCKKVVGAAAGASALLLIGLVAFPGKPGKPLFGDWRIDVEATRALPVYVDQDVSHMDTWTADKNTLVRIRPGTMHFWERDWPYRVLESDDHSITVELADVKYDTKHRSVFAFVDDGVVFDFMPDASFVLERDGDAGTH